MKWIIVESNGNYKLYFHNAGVGGSSPPITTIFYKAFSLLYLLIKNSGTTRGQHQALFLVHTPPPKHHLSLYT